MDNPRIGIQESDTGFRGFREGSCLRKTLLDSERERERERLGTISITGWSLARPTDRRCLALCSGGGGGGGVYSYSSDTVEGRALRDSSQ